MHNSLDVWLDGLRDPVTVQPITMDFVDYQRLLGAGTANGAEIRLVVAYLHLVDSSPKTIREVHTWARTHKVTVMEREDDAPGPTLTGPSPD